MSKTCSTANCTSTSYAKGLCNRHYLQVRKYGTTQKTSASDRKATIRQGYALVPLGKDARYGYAKVDPQDAWVSKYCWSRHHGYAEGLVDGKYMSMHRLIAQPEERKQVDHINHDTLDNRKSNLRVCTKTQNRRNSRPVYKNTTGLKGVTQQGRKYVTYIGYLGKKLCLGRFDSPEEAGRAYDTKAVELFGEFAYVNYKEKPTCQP